MNANVVSVIDFQRLLTAFAEKGLPPVWTETTTQVRNVLLSAAVAAAFWLFGLGVPVPGSDTLLADGASATASAAIVAMILGYAVWAYRVAATCDIAAYGFRIVEPYELLKDALKSEGARFASEAAKSFTSFGLLQQLRAEAIAVREKREPELEEALLAAICEGDFTTFHELAASVDAEIDQLYRSALVPSPDWVTATTQPALHAAGQFNRIMDLVQKRDSASRTERVVVLTVGNGTLVAMLGTLLFRLWG